MRTHGLGIIGAGHVAGAHLRAAAFESTQVRAIADTHPEPLAFVKGIDAGTSPPVTPEHARHLVRSWRPAWSHLATAWRSC